MKTTFTTAFVQSLLDYFDNYDLVVEIKEATHEIEEEMVKSLEEKLSKYYTSLTKNVYYYMLAELKKEKRWQLPDEFTATDFEPLACDFIETHIRYCRDFEIKTAKYIPDTAEIAVSFT